MPSKGKVNLESYAVQYFQRERQHGAEVRAEPRIRQTWFEAWLFHPLALSSQQANSCLWHSVPSSVKEQNTGTYLARLLWRWNKITQEEHLTCCFFQTWAAEVVPLLLWLSLEHSVHHPYMYHLLPSLVKRVKEEGLREKYAIATALGRQPEGNLTMPDSPFLPATFATPSMAVSIQCIMPSVPWEEPGRSPLHIHVY